MKLGFVDECLSIATLVTYRSSRFLNILMDVGDVALTTSSGSLFMVALCNRETIYIFIL